MWQQTLRADHANAALLARGLVEAGRGTLRIAGAAAGEGTSSPEAAAAAVQTNIVYFDYDPAAVAAPALDLEAMLARRGVLIGGGYTAGSDGGLRRYRAVLHRGVSREAVHAAVDAVAHIFAAQ